MKKPVSQILTSLFFVLFIISCDNRGIEEKNVDFTATQTNVDVGQIVEFKDASKISGTNWLWNFGDGGTSTMQNPTHIYTKAGEYTVKLSVSNKLSTETATKKNYIIVSEVMLAPVTAFSASSTSIKTGQSIQFTDMSTNTPTSWSWNFGDGGTSSAQNPSHKYTTAGTFIVQLTATNAYGNDTEVKTIVVSVGSSPVAAFSASSTSVYRGVSIQFTDSSTNTPTSWSWDFGDNTTSTLQNPSHSYSSVGTYTVKLTATNAYGSGSETKTNYITVDYADSSLILYYPFNGNSNDENLGIYNGIVNGATLCNDKDGNANSAYYFDGTDDYIQATDFANSLPETNISISMWVQSMESKVAWQMSLALDSCRLGISIDYSHNGTNSIFWDYGNISFGRLSVSNTLSTSWHHYVFISSYTEIFMKIYLDGVLLTSNSSPTQFYKTSDKNLKIGSGNKAGFFHGSLDDIRVYNRVLSEIEIQDLYTK